MRSPLEQGPDELGLRLELRGLVQGIGFRPQMLHRACSLGLTGWIANSGEGVVIEAQGPRPALERYVRQLIEEPPELSRITALQQIWLPIRQRYPGFEIAPPLQQGNASALLSPDLALCRDCEGELRDPGNRRCNYPFISCTQCGPRYSVVRELPFERDATSYGDFPLCSACEREYRDPQNRRFHAQTISCPVCGPQLQWNGSPQDVDAALTATVAALEQGEIVAIKGIGGFQLLADPRSPEALHKLRQRKGRPDKPLALLSTEAWVRDLCVMTDHEAELFASRAAAIVLMRRRPAAVVDPGVAGSSPWLGVMRPASALQLLVLERFGRPLVATSANRSGEPICSGIGDDHRLKPLCDGVLSHDLAIVNRIDDSVIRAAAGSVLVLRLGRGLAPVALPSEVAQAGAALAMGAQMKAAVALRQRDQLVLSPDLGDASSTAGTKHLEDTTDQWLHRHQLRPRRIACDKHPAYHSSESARERAKAQSTDLSTVQHHHAHLLAVMAEHALKGSALGVAWDGSGFGDDGTLWGGELLQVTSSSSQRLGHLRPFPLPGGERAIREPRRVVLGLLREAYGSAWRQRLQQLPTLEWCHSFDPGELNLLERGLETGVSGVLCSSVGRLFDGVAALLDLQQVCSYEAQAAMALEGLAETAAPQQSSYSLPLVGSEPFLWDWQPMLEQILRDREQGRSCAAMARSFHQGLAEALASAAERLQSRQILLAGGCFQNRLLLELSLAALQSKGIEAFWSQRLPSNDAAIPIGQLMALP